MRRVDRFPVPPGQSSDLFGYVAKWLVLLAIFSTDQRERSNEWRWDQCIGSGGENTEREALPVASDEERPVQGARRPISRRA
jgi:hypothetical protein